MSMWEPYTERARRAIVLAQEETVRLGNEYIGTEHILLGILAEGESVAAIVLGRLGITFSAVRQEVEKIVGRGNSSKRTDLVFTSRSKRVFELAFSEATELNHNYIGTEHLLLALVREGEGVASRVLANLGADGVNIRSAVIDVVTNGEGGVIKKQSVAEQMQGQQMLMQTKVQRQLLTQKRIPQIRAVALEPFRHATKEHVEALDCIAAYGFNVPKGTAALIAEVAAMLENHLNECNDS